MGLSIRRRLQLSLAAIALAALGVAATNAAQARRLEGDARAVNLAGSQRMRAYRLAMLAAQYAAHRDVVTADAIEAELARAHEVLALLRTGRHAPGVVHPPPPEAAAALEEAADLLPRYEALIRDVVREADAAPAESTESTRALALQVQAVVAMGTSLAERMDAATGALERASAAAARRLGDLQLALFATTAAVAVLSFESLRRALGRALPALEGGLHDLARGRLGRTVPIEKGPGELAALERAFNETSRELARAQRAIREHEAELERRNEALERADRLKSQFLATMSHELRTPLTSIIGYADYLQRGLYGPLDPKQADRVGAILRNGRHLLALIGDILDIAKIEAGKMDVRLEPTAIAPLVREAADAFRPQAEAKGIALHVEDGGPDLRVTSDPARLRQILYNLVSNAVKFTDRGSVRIRASAVPGGGARIEVEDTGIGIAAADMPRLFRQFEQIDGSATRRHGGTGLGLHISKRLADLLGGRIDVRSEPGRGSAFALEIPDRPDRARVVDATAAPTSGAGKEG